MRENPDKVDWNSLCWNTNAKAIALLQTIDWTVSDNNAICYWRSLSYHANKESDFILLSKRIKENPESIDWSSLSLNENDGAIQLLLNAIKENPKRVDWCALCFNTHDGAIDILEQNQNKINWQVLCENKNKRVMDVLKENQEKIYWNSFSQNPAIFYDECSYVLK